MGPLPYSWDNGLLVLTQAVLVALPGAGLPARLQALAGRWWSLVLPLSIAVVIGVLAVLPGAADGLTWLALVAIPPLAALALGWAARAARPAAALLAAPLLVLALADVGGRAGQLAALVLTSLSCVTLGRLLAGGAPTPWLRAGLVAMAAIDAILVFSHGIDQPNAALVSAAPGPGLPSLQDADSGFAGMGYGDVFVAGVLGGVLAAERVAWRRQATAAVAVLVASLAFDCLFEWFDTLPATVPIAVVALAFGGLRGQRPGSRATRRRRAARSSWSVPSHPPPGPRRRVL